MGQISGSTAETNDNDPVEVRLYQILGSDLVNALGGIPTSPIRYRWLIEQGYIFWQYFPNGIIISTPDTCACVLYGPIYQYWDQTGQFDGPLGAPSTDVLRLPSPPSSPGSPPPPPGASYAVFQHGVLYLDPDINAQVVELSPVQPDTVASSTGIMPTGDGIAQAANDTIQAFANNALVTNQHLSNNVASISTRTLFNSTGPGGCSGSSFNAVGRSLLRSHILNVHFDFDLKGCAGTFGNATADVRIEVRLFIDPPNVTARLVSYSIDGVSSPYSAGDQDIRDGLAQSLNGQFGRNLLNRTIPKGITVIAAIVENTGDVNLYIAPICAAKNVLQQSAGTEGVLSRMRELRDSYLVNQNWGREFIDLVDAWGPAFLAGMRDQRDGVILRQFVTRVLTEAFTENADLQEIMTGLEEVNRDLKTLLSHPAMRYERVWPERFIRSAISYARDHLHKDVSFADAVVHVRRVIHEEAERCRDRENRDRSAN